MRNLVAAFKHHAGCGYIDKILELKSKSHYDYIQECYFPKSNCRTKGFHFEDVDKWCGEWSKLHHTNAT
jgi:hypothetical protein